LHGTFRCSSSGTDPVSRHGWNRDPLTRGGAPGRTGKQPDGSAKTGEVKLCTIWNAESLDEEGTPIRDEGSVTYSAALESACALDTAAARSPFAERVWREATRRRFCQAPRTVVLGDGALWIWNIADDQFPDATQIVDRFHAKRHLSDLEKLFPVPPPHGLLNGGTSEGRTRHRKILGVTHRHPSPGVPRRGRASLSPLFPDQPRAYALSGEFRPSKPISVDTPKFQTLSGLSGEHQETRLQRFPLPWSHYVRLLAVKGKEARVFYETEALRGGWSVRQLDRQIATQFYERTALSRNKAALIKRPQRSIPEDQLTAEEEIKDPMVLEFLGLKDEYSESALEDALIHRLEQFLLELGNDFSFIARQKRLRVGDEWYRVDLLFFHRRLRCLVIIDIKIGRFAHADAGQMNLYLNYAREHWTLPGENPPIGLILSSEKNEAVAHYALGNLRNKVLSSEYKLALPDEKKLAEEIARTRKSLIQRKL